MYIIKCISYSSDWNWLLLSFILCDWFIVMIIVFNCLSVIGLYFIKQKAEVNVFSFKISLHTVTFEYDNKTSYQNSYNLLSVQSMENISFQNDKRPSTVRVRMTLCICFLCSRRCGVITFIIWIAFCANFTAYMYVIFIS